MTARGRPFRPGNKYGRGRPRGSRNKSSRLGQDALDRHGEALIQKCLLLAFQGHPTALRLCMERLMPARRQRALRFKLPALKTLTDVDAASELVLGGVAHGKLTPAEGEAVAGMLDGRRRMIEFVELERRIRVLEDANQATRRGY